MNRVGPKERLAAEQDGTELSPEEYSRWREQQGKGREALPSVTEWKPEERPMRQVSRVNRGQKEAGGQSRLWDREASSAGKHCGVLRRWKVQRLFLG